MSDDSRTPATDGDGLVHEALLYRGRAELRDALREFVRAAAAAGEPVMAALPRTNLTWLAPLLANDGFDVRFEDMSEVGRNPGCLPAMIQDWVDDHDGRARVISEPMWPGRSYAEPVECLRHEALLNYALEGTPVKVLCPYDAEHLEAGVLEGAALTHPQLRDRGGSRRSERFEDPVRVFRGERWPLDEAVEPVAEHIFGGDLPSLRRAVGEDPGLGALDAERRADMVFVVNEAVTNVLRHGDGNCRVRVWHDGRSVVSEVSSATPVSDLLAGRRRPRRDAPSGRGLWLINQICDLVELRSGGQGMTLRMHVR